ncbi:hypothetical protein PC111_g11835 [Phytophthora cactorum]|nr:hypothetical protein PC111_g11835 [Phytophthora cactorum]
MSSDPNGFGKGGMPTQFMSPSGGGAGIGGQVDRVTKEGGAVVKDGHHLVAIKKEGRWALTAAAQMKECGLIKAGSLRAEGKAGGEVVKGGHLQVVVKDPLGVTKAEERSVSIAAAQLKAGGLHRVVVKAGERLVVVPKKAGGRHQVEGKDPGLRLVVVPRKVSGRHQVEGEDPGLRVLTMEARVLVDRLQRLVLVFPDQTGDSTTDVSGVSSGNGDGESTTTESSGVPSSAGDQVAQTSMTETTSSAETPTESSTGADADRKRSLRS